MSKIKKVVCKNWTEKKCKFMDDSKLCSFAHGDDDIVKNECFNGIYCWNENCDYKHPQDWNPYINKKECLICIKGYCNKKNKKYNHIKDESINNTEDNKNIISGIPKHEDFPEIVKNIKNKDNHKKIYEYKYSEILTSNLKNDLNIKNDNIEDIIHIKNQLKDNYILLSRLDHKNWSNYGEIDNIKNNIKDLEYKYNEIKNKDKIENIFDNDLNLNIIFNNNNSNENKDSEENYEIPNIKLTIDGVEIDNITDKPILENIFKEEQKSDDNIEVVIKNMEKYFKIYNEKIKKDINNTIKDNNCKFILLNNLNQISSIINLLINNYKDIKKEN